MASRRETLLAMTQNYLIKLKTQHNGTFHILVKFNEFGNLIYVELRNVKHAMRPNQRYWLWVDFIPKTTQELEDLGKNKQLSVKITPIQTDLSFNAFWELYSHKVGNKKRAEGHWKKLDDSTRAMVMQKVKEYNFYMQHVSHAKVFAERFLSEKRYENDFTIK